jgi:hypothetical protein
MAYLEPVKADFGVDGNKCLDNYVYDNVSALRQAYMSLHTNDLPRWRRITKGKPKDKTKDFPWPGASNVIIQLVGENVDTIKAIQLGTIYEILPIWVAELVGEWKIEDKGEEQRRALEAFLSNMALSRSELDLYRVESRAAYDIASLGSVCIKLPWITLTEQVVTGIGDSGQFNEDTITTYDGPKPEKLAYEDWAATPSANTWEEAQFKYHVLRLTKQQCEHKVVQGIFDKNVWEVIKDKPDINGLTPEETQKNQDGVIQDPTPIKDMTRWQFYECWFKYFVGDKMYNILYIMHFATKQRMNAVFNFYPKNEEPFEFGRLGYSEDGLLGYGYAEMGEMYQEEVSTGHNQRVDNRTLANTSVVLGGNNPRMDAGISLYPMAVLPFDKNDVSIEQLGSNYPSSVQEEELTIALFKARCGTDMPGIEGMGSGTVNKKGAYSSMGTFSIMQQGTRRININVSDFRYMHLNIGQKSSKQYAYFGVGDNRLKVLGLQAEMLRRAMEAIKQGRLELPIRAATASINKEIEKQTGMLFTQVMQRHYMAITQLLQAYANPIAAQQLPELRTFFLESISGLAYIMSKLLRSFGYDDLRRVQPELSIVDKLQEKEKGANSGQQGLPNNAGAITGGNGRSNIPEVAQQSNNGGSPSLIPNAESGGGVFM